MPVKRRSGQGRVNLGVLVYKVLGISFAIWLLPAIINFCCELLACHHALVKEERTSHATTYMTSLERCSSAHVTVFMVIIDDKRD